MIGRLGVAQKMGKQKVVIFGTNSLAANALAFYKEDDEHEVVALTVTADCYTDTHFYGYPVVFFEELTEKYPSSEYKVFVAVGYSDLNRARERVMGIVKEAGYELASCISPKANVYAESLGENVYIYPGCTVEPYVKIGDGVVICSNTYIAHFCQISDYTYISGGTTIAGTSSIGHHSIIGCNSTVGANISLGEFNFLGDGALVCHSTEPQSVYIPQQTQVGPLKAEKMKVMLLEPLSKRACRK